MTSSASSRGSLRSPLLHLDPSVVSAAARAETRNREIHLPPVSVYRWWARRTESVNGALLDAVAKDVPGRLLVADPFAGGGVIPLAAVMRGHRVYAQDLNPWAAAGLAAMLGLPEPDALQSASKTLADLVRGDIDDAYGTELSDGTAGHVSHTFRVATAECSACRTRARMFPHALISLVVRRERRRPEAFLACPAGDVFLGREGAVTSCPICGASTDPAVTYSPARIVQCSCGHQESLEQRARSGTWQWQVVLVERARRGRRELAIPTRDEVTTADNARWAPMRDLGEIPDGQETRVLKRHGFARWSQLYPARQRVLLERLLTAAEESSEDEAVVSVVRMAVVGSAEMAGHLSRWDRFYLKSYESMAGHRFNFTTLAVEPNVWGTPASGRGTAHRRLVQLVKAANWLHRQTGSRVSVSGPLTETDPVSPQDEDVRVVEGSSERMLLPAGSVHLVLTDPPYHDDVQYSELSLPLRAWAGLGGDALLGEAVVNDATGQLVDEGAYEGVLTRIFAEARRTLRADGHLIFSYANRSPAAWTAVFSALERAGLRSIGCEILHSENETDHAKRGVRACTLDLILDLVPAGEIPIQQHRPVVDGSTAELRFLAVIAETFRRVGSLEAGWREQLSRELRASDFLAGKSIVPAHR